MFVLDLNNIMMANLMQQFNFKNPQEGNTEELFRHMLLNTIRYIRRRFKNQYGEMIIANDRKSWRKDVFPYYKANRAKRTEDSLIDWSVVFSRMDVIKQEIRDHLPYRMVEATGAEADDVIYWMSRQCAEREEDLLIVSADKDFSQLHGPGVRQYDPVMKKDFVEIPDPEAYLREHIVRGDSGDGVPNCLSQDDCLVIGKRQTTLSKKRFERLMEIPPKFDNETEKRYYERNRTLIDLRNVPQSVLDAIAQSFELEGPVVAEKRQAGTILPYFIDKKLKQHTANINDFR